MKILLCISLCGHLLGDKDDKRACVSEPGGWNFRGRGLTEHKLIWATLVQKMYFLFLDICLKGLLH